MGRQTTSLRGDAANATYILGAMIKQARIAKRMTIADLAGAIRVSAPTVSAIEAGKGSVSIAHYLNAAVVLDVPLFGEDKVGRGRLADLKRESVALLPSRVPPTPEMSDDF